MSYHQLASSVPLGGEQRNGKRNVGSDAGFGNHKTQRSGEAVSDSTAIKIEASCNHNFQRSARELHAIIDVFMPNCAKPRFFLKAGGSQIFKRKSKSTDRLGLSISALILLLNLSVVLSG